VLNRDLYLEVLRRRGDEESDLKCGLLEVGSSITIMRLLTQHCQLDNSWQNIQFLPFQKKKPYSPDLSPPDIFLFPKLKITLKGRFQMVENMMTNVTNDLKAIPQTSFKQRFQKWK
jgi:hypothetical protein